MLSEREWKKKKAVLSASTELLKLGGIIREMIEGEYLSLYSDETAELICKDHKIDANFFRVADKLDEVAEELNEQFEYFTADSFSEDGETSDPPRNFYKGYIQWYLEQTVRLCYDKYENSDRHFWQDWKMTYRAKKRMDRLNPLEERILFLSWGLDQNGKKRSATAIAELPEFACDPALIRQVRKALKGYLFESISVDMVQKEIIRKCEEERNIAAQKQECDK